MNCLELKRELETTTIDFKGHLIEISPGVTTRFLTTLIDGEHRKGLPSRRNLEKAIVDAKKSIENQRHYGRIIDLE